MRVRASHHILSLHVLATVIEKKDCDYETVKPYLKIIKGGAHKDATDEGYLSFYMDTPRAVYVHARSRALTGQTSP